MTGWSVDPGRFASSLIRLAAEGYDAPRDSPGWALAFRSAERLAPS